MTEITERVFVPLSMLECIKGYTLVGGTALAIQIGHRLSVDLDFMKWSTSKKNAPEVDWFHIEEQLQTIGDVQSVNVMGFDHAEFLVSGVKVSFYATSRRQPQMTPIHCLNNIYLADIAAIGAMKMEVLMRRSTFRDYYDIYSILCEGLDFEPIMNNALAHSRHMLKSKNLLAMLSDSSRFVEDEQFAKLNPKYLVSAKDIENFLKEKIRLM